jgi:LysR family transcriptional regulator, nitrogen assimilation regulatory protein
MRFPVYLSGRNGMTECGVDLKQLEYFVHVAELGSFTRASGFLRVAQPALSRQIRSLEVELRQTLFERNGRGVVLTEPGKRLLAHGRGSRSSVRARTWKTNAARPAATWPWGCRRASAAP